jgi:hypothetical protein
MAVQSRAFWVIALCRVERARCFIRTYSLFLQGWGVSHLENHQKQVTLFDLEHGAELLRSLKKKRPPADVCHSLFILVAPSELHLKFLGMMHVDSNGVAEQAVRGWFGGLCDVGVQKLIISA